MDPTFHQLAYAAAGDQTVSIQVWPWASFSLASAIITALLAPARGRSAFGWFLIGGFLPWLSILILYLIRDRSAVDVRPGPAGVGTSGTAPGGQTGAPQPAPAVSEPAASLPQDGWFYAVREQPMGPVSLQYLRSMIDLGSLSRDVPVWCSAFRDWVKPTRVPGFFG